MKSTMATKIATMSNELSTLGSTPPAMRSEASSGPTVRLVSLDAITQSPCPVNDRSAGPKPRCPEHIPRPAGAIMYGVMALDARVDPDAEFTIDQLAMASGLTTRN